MNQRSIEVLIGHLITDATFRNTFRHEPYAANGTFMLAGHDLSEFEISALAAILIELWDRDRRADRQPPPERELHLRHGQLMPPSRT